MTIGLGIIGFLAYKSLTKKAAGVNGLGRWVHTSRGLEWQSARRLKKTRRISTPSFSIAPSSNRVPPIVSFQQYMQVQDGRASEVRAPVSAASTKAYIDRIIGW